MTQQSDSSLDSSLNADDFYPDPIKAKDRENTSPHVSSAEYLRLQMSFERTLNKAMDSMERNMERKLRESTTEIKEFIKTGFPGGDLSGHKHAHEAQMVVARRWGDIRAKFIEKVFTTGMYAALVFLGIAVWEALKKELTS